MRIFGGCAERRVGCGRSRRQPAGVRQDAQFGSLSVEKLLGALPVVAGFSSRLRIRDVIDGACPVRDLAELTHGQVIEVLMANRLTGLPHVFRTGELMLFHAASCRFRYSSWTSCGVL